MDPATQSSTSVLPMALPDSQARETTGDSSTPSARLVQGQVARTTSQSTVVPNPLLHVPSEHLQDVESTGSSTSHVNPTQPEPATRLALESDLGPQILERNHLSNRDGPYPARHSRTGPSTSWDFDHFVRGTSRSRDGHRPWRATALVQEYPNIPTDLIPKVNRQLNRTVGERIQPTVEAAEYERAKYAVKARWTGYALNFAIGLQVLLGSLTTGLSAVTEGKQTSIATTILGVFSVLVASYLARMRGSNEPELSITRVKDLDQFLRDCRAFQMDHGQEHGTSENGLTQRVQELRSNFEELLGNGDGQRKLSPV